MFMWRRAFLLLLLSPMVYCISLADQVIYPGKVLNADCFRIGNIGHLFPADMKHLLACVREVCKDMGMPLPLT